MFSNLLKTGIHFVDLSGVHDTAIEGGMAELPWDSIVGLFGSHTYQKNKDGRCFIPAKFKPKSEWVVAESDHESYRNDANIESITMVVLDLDVPGAKEKAEQMFSGFEYLLYSTHSFSKDEPYKFRMVLRLEDPIPTAEWPTTFNAIIRIIDGDKSCGRFSSVFYFPAHNPSAGIRPFMYHNKGLSLSKSHLNDFVRSAEQRFGTDAISGGKKDYSSEKQSAHFSGARSSLKIEPVDYTYDGMLKRFSRNITDLQSDDNRHAFALTVTAKDIAINKDRCDLFQLIQFIFRASAEYSSKPLTDPSGNTASELPEMIHSAIKKYSPDMLDPSKGGVANIRDYVRNIIKDIRPIAVKGAWRFESVVRSINPVEMVKKNIGSLISDPSNNTLDSWMARHRGILRKYVGDGDHCKFAASVYESEKKILGDDMNVNTYGQFVFYCIDNTLSKVKNISGDAKKIEMQRILGELTSSEVVSSIEQNQDSGKFLVAAFKIANASANKGEWKFSAQKDSPSINM